MTVNPGSTYKLKSGSLVRVIAVIDDVVYIVRPDGKFPRGVRLDWLAPRIVREVSA